MRVRKRSQVKLTLSAFTEKLDCTSFLVKVGLIDSRRLLSREILAKGANC